MTDGRHTRVADLFLAACELEGEARTRYLDQACAADATLRAEVEQLLDYDAKRTPIDRPLDLEWAEGDPLGAPLPARIGRYEIVRLLGEGGMGTVYQARQTNPTRDVALKVMRPGTPPSLIRRFALEAEVLGLLQHPGIAQIYEAGTAEAGSGAQPYFAMELVPGEPLLRFADRRGISVRERLELLALICDAVHHAHQRGVIHRDLKPGNILVTERGEPKVLDFGVARATDSDVLCATLATDVGQLVGTVPYMSPEQISGDPDAIDVRSDVFALGVVGYELLTGKLPHDVAERSIADAARVIRDEVPTRLGSLSRTFRGDLDTIFAKALEKQKDRRYPSVAALHADLQRHLRHEPITARPPTVTYQLSTFARRHKGLMAGVVGTFLALVAGIIVSTTLYLQADVARQQAERERTAAENARAAEQTAREQADRNAEIAAAVNDFLTTDLLAAVSPWQTPDRDVTMRDVLDAAARDIDVRFPDDPEIEASVRNAMGSAYRELGEFDLAKRHLRAALRLRRDFLGEDHIATAIGLNDAALLYRDQGKPRQALPMLERALEIAQAELPAGHRDLLTIMANLGNVRFDMGDDPGAEALLKPALAGLEATRGGHDVVTTRVRVGLARVYSRQERFRLARDLLETCLIQAQDAFGDDHPDTLSAHNNVGKLLLRIGENDNAEQHLRAAVDIGRRLLGERHPRMVIYLSNLAGVYEVRGDTDDAIAQYEQALTLSTASHGQDSATTLTVMNNLAGVLDEAGRIDEARALCEQVLAARARTLGDGHLMTIAARHNLAVRLATDGELEDAAKLFHDALSSQVRLQGQWHGATLQMRSNLASVYIKQEKFAEAAALLEPTVEHGRQRWPGTSVPLASAIRRLGVARAGLGDAESAEALLREGHAIMQAAVGAHHVRTTSCVRALITFYEQRGDAEGAATWRERLPPSTAR